MSTAIITGSAGLVGSECVRFLTDKGFTVVGIDNDMRRYFFGDEASTRWRLEELLETVPGFRQESVDVRDYEQISRVFQSLGSDTQLVIHTAAQPSHDWAAREPFTDFGVNANGTLNLLEATRAHCPDAVFIFTSTNKVYGDAPNRLPLVELESRWEIASDHPYYAQGIDESLSIDNCMHSIFGASKVAADIMVQEYGRYFGMKTGVFRGGCLTGPAHSGAELHGFLAYLMRCAATGREYRVFGYGGKQVRDNIHSFDLVNAFYAFYEKPSAGQAYNMGGGRYSNCSLVEAVKMCEEITGNQMKLTYVDQARSGDHIWWISDTAKFQEQCADWTWTRDVRSILSEIYEANHSRW